MSKSSLRGLLAALALLLSSPTSWAAEVTDVADAADTIRVGNLERDDSFDMYIWSQFEQVMSNGKITREPIDRAGLSGSCSAATSRDCLPVDELRWQRAINRLNIGTQIGFFQDMALTAGWSYTFADDVKFRYANGVTAANSTVDPQTGDPNDSLFAHNFKSRLKGSGDLNLGLKIGALNDERDESKPSWVLYVNWAAPWTTSVYRPDKKRATIDEPGPVGDGVHRITFGTSLSKRIANLGLIGIDPNVHRRGYIDPYMDFSYTLPVPQRGQGTDASLIFNKKTNPFGAPPSHVANFNAGFEIVPYEDMKDSRKVAIDLGLRTQFNSEGRNYSLLASPLGELTYEDQHLYVGGAFGIYAQAAEFLRIKTGVGFGFVTEHFLTNEDVGDDKNGDKQVLLPEEDTHTVKDLRNPYFCGNDENDLCSTKGLPSYDQVGFRFKDEEHVVLNWFVTLQLTL